MPVPDFSVGEVFTAAAADQIGLWKITSGTISSQGTTPTNFQGVFNSTNYKHYRLALYGDNGATNPRLQLRLLNGTTPAQTGAYYAGGLAGNWSADSIVYFQRSNGETQLFLGFANNQDRSLMFDIMYPHEAEYTTFSGHATFIGDAQTYSWGGTHLVQTAYDGFQLFTSAGTIRLRYDLYGYRA